MSFIERINLTIRQSVSKLTRRTWGPAHYSPELLEHLEWWCCFYTSPVTTIAWLSSSPIRSRAKVASSPFVTGTEPLRWRLA